MMNEAQARRLAALLTEQQKQDITLLARVLRTDTGRGRDHGRRRAGTYERAEQRY